MNELKVSITQFELGTNVPRLIRIGNHTYQTRGKSFRDIAQEIKDMALTSHVDAIRIDLQLNDIVMELVAMKAELVTADIKVHGFHNEVVSQPLGVM